MQLLMRRTRLFNLSVYIIASALILISAAADTSAQRKSRGGKKSSSASAKKSGSRKATRAKSDGKKSARGKSSSKSGRERRAVAKRGRRERGRTRYASRRAKAPLRASSEREADGQEPSAPQPRIVTGGIQSDRVTEIQNALMKAGAFEGPSTGLYDEMTSAAMKKFQVNNGLPATGLPSAHTLKKLGVSKRSNDGYAVQVTSSREKRQE